MRRSRNRAVRGVAVMFVVFGLLLSVGCSDDECLVYGENCTESYKLNNYGTTGIQCCQGVCETGVISGVLVCR